MTEVPLNLPMDDHELQLVDGFRQSRNTSVLTIMFTDIQGFTKLTEERGDAYSNEVRRAHDSLLVPVIERDGAGRVIKHFGDAVMAVFSEPSTAVSRALEIQEVLRRYSAQHSDQPPILVRIGLHMGQVTVEDKVSMDVFGRHVNRASRVEGLADGGHIYLTYTVFDSAKGWMAGKSSEAAWVSHGRYRVKGIDEPLEIFEAYRPGGVKPRRPAGARRQTPWPPFSRVAALVLAGALGMLFLLGLKPTVIFEDLGVRTDTTDVMLDHKTRLQLEGNPGDHLRKCLTKIKAGNHLIYYDVSYVTRYYSPVTVRRGKNILRPQFEYFGLPGVEGNTSFDKHGKNEQVFSNATTYATYDDSLARHEHQANLTLDMKSAQGPMSPPVKGVKKHHTLYWTLEWKVDLDGKTISSDKTIVEHDPEASDSTEVKKPLWEDSRHRYVLTYILNGISAQGEIQAEYAEYK